MVCDVGGSAGEAELLMLVTPGCAVHPWARGAG